MSTINTKTNKKKYRASSFNNSEGCLDAGTSCLESSPNRCYSESSTSIKPTSSTGKMVPKSRFFYENQKSTSKHSEKSSVIKSWKMSEESSSYCSENSKSHSYPSQNSKGKILNQPENSVSRAHSKEIVSANKLSPTLDTSALPSLKILSSKVHFEPQFDKASYL